MAGNQAGVISTGSTLRASESATWLQKPGIFLQHSSMVYDTCETRSTEVKHYCRTSEGRILETPASEWDIKPHVPVEIAVLFFAQMTIQISLTTSLSDPAQLAHTAFILSCISFSICALGIYEHMVTMHKELTYVWCHRFTPVSMLLLLLRYSTLAYGCIAVGSSMVVTDKMCAIMGRLSEISNFLSMTVVYVASALRVYALSRKSWILSIVALLGIASAIFSIRFAFRLSPVTTSITGARCLQVYKPYRGTSLSFVDSSGVLVQRLSTALVDLVVVIVTLKATMSGYRAARRVNIRVPIMTTLLRDGTLYFSVAFVMNIAQIVLYESLHELYLTSFIFITTSILLSRLLLNLRKNGADNTGIDPDPPYSSHNATTIMVFSSLTHRQEGVDHSEDRDLEMLDSRRSHIYSGSVDE